MAPKKGAADGDSTALLVGFSDKETKLLAAAFVSCIGTDKYDYDLMAMLTKNTAGSLKKMYPPVKKKAIENYPSFAGFLGQSGTASTATTAPEPKALKKRKTGDDKDDDVSDSDKADTVKSPVAKKVKKAPTRGRGRPKKEESANGDDDLAEDEDI